jgi:thiamine-phosphate pyrophosphorylase
MRGLYVITDTALGDSLIPAVDAALAGGATIVQYRDKTADHDRRHAEAKALLTLCRAYHCLLLINDDIELAASIGAHGVHLGRKDGSIAQARQQLGTEAIIGATCHNSLDFAEQATAEGANYLAFGAFYPSQTKPNASVAELNILHSARQFGLPLVAIGGITLENARPLISAGADCVAVINDIFGRPINDIHQRAALFSQLFSQSASE